jgi:DNA-binding beta-propeller fold protein YncE
VRWLLALVAAVAAVAAVACSAGTHPAASRMETPAVASPGAGSARPASAAGRVPGCSTATASAPILHSVPTSMELVPSEPFGVVTAGRWAFVGFTGSGSVGVFRAGVFRAGVTAASTTLVRQVVVGGGPSGEALTPDGHYLLAADEGGGAAVISVSRAEQGGAGALVGTLGSLAAGGAIEAAASPDGRFAFVSLEDTASIAVFNLSRALARGFGPSDLVGTIPVGIAPVGLAVSPDGRWLYATSEVAGPVPLAARSGHLAPKEVPQPVQGAQGTLTVISLRRAETDPAHAVVSTVDAGCSPVRVITSADGGVVWVTARESDSLLGFSAGRLRTDPARALVARVEVGEAPVGLALVDGGTRIVVADSNRFSANGAAASLAVVGVAAALAGRPALLGYIETFGFPREMAAEPGGRVLLVTDFSSQWLQAVDVARLP